MAAASVETKAFDFVKILAQENSASHPSTPPCDDRKLWKVEPSHFLATWSLYENLLQSSSEVIYTVVILPDTFTNTVQSMCNTYYMVEVGYMPFSCPNHSYIYFLTIVDF